MSHFQEVMYQLTTWFVSYEEYKCFDKDCTNLLNYIDMYDNDFEDFEDEYSSFSRRIFRLLNIKYDYRS